jgi:photosystem II stability/assembly factor-like uncharacterized protein
MKQTILNQISLYFLLLFSMLTFSAARASTLSFADPLNAPATPVREPMTAPMIGLATAGDHLVTAGSRGIVLFSKGYLGGWRQAVVPVQSDFTSVQFLNAQDGWACGQDGVVIHSSDGGRTWTKQLDGNSAQVQFESYYKTAISNGNSALESDLQQIQLNFDGGPTLPWLGIWFGNKNVGYIVGPFGNIASTNDGGKSWQPWLDHIDNPNFLDLNAITSIDNNLYIVGEQGSVYVFDKEKQKFIAYSTGDSGSLFGITGNNRVLVVFGVEGKIFRSVNQGISWSPVPDPSNAGIMSGTVLSDGRIMLVTLDGSILSSDDGAKTFYQADNTQGMALSDVAGVGGNKLVITGLEGIRYVAEK